MTISWGTKIAVLYSTFVVGIGGLVYASTRTKFELVSDDYYQQEVQYQKVIDATKNGSALSTPLTIDAGVDGVGIAFPKEFAGKEISAHILCYAPVNSAWDRTLDLKTTTAQLFIDAAKLKPTRYQVKVTWTAAGVTYYQQAELNLIRK